MMSLKNGIIVSEIDRVAAEIVDKARGLSSATVHEAGGKIGVVPSSIKPIHPEFRICGPTVVVHSPPGDNLWLHYAILVAQPGDVLLVYCEGAYDYGYWGEVMSTAAAARKLGGLVIDGCVRDFTLLQEVGFPVFARGLCIRGTAKDRNAYGAINRKLRIEGLTIEAGDLVIGDNDGVVVVPKQDAASVVEASVARDAKELWICEQLQAGATTLDIYGLV
jgi:4-hydroxy-4-methyl-2-oxoglutarate aldolase